MIGNGLVVDNVFSVLLGVFDGIIWDVVVVEAEEDEVGNLVDTVVSVVVVESEVKSEVGVYVSINV